VAAAWAVTELVLELGELLDDRDRELGEGGGIEHQHLGTGMPVHAGDDLAVGGADVGGVEGTVEAPDQEPGNGLGAGAGGLEVLAVVGGLQLGDPDPVELDQDEQQGEQHPDEDGGQQPQHQAAGRGDDRDPELEPAEPPEPPEGGRVDQPEHGQDDHAAQGRLGEVAEGSVRGTGRSRSPGRR
jgi:hypothetical protein